MMYLALHGVDALLAFNRQHSPFLSVLSPNPCRTTSSQLSGVASHYFFHLLLFFFKSCMVIAYCNINT